VVTLYVACPALIVFFRLINDPIFGGKKNFKNKMCFDFLCDFFLRKMFHSEKNLGR
jgi:hypothetical protein